MELATRPLIAMPIQYGLCVSQKAYAKALRKNNLLGNPVEWIKNGANATTHHFIGDNGQGMSVVCIQPSHVTNNQIASLLVHEAVHIWQECRDRMGEVNPSREFEAYAIQGISQELMEMYDHLTAEK